jgi:arsenite/tail-anchored protein-transporting ATPase
VSQLSDRQFNDLQLAMFSGKGGVGKTTCSCGFARQWAQKFPQERILLISTDPAHSLGDVLQLAIADKPLPLADLPNLQVRALDSEKLLQEFKTRYGKVLELLVERGSFVQGEDLSPIWDLSWPGLDELMGILEIQRILREQEADRVVVDMAPSGHTLNLFGLMDFLDGFLDALDLFQEKHRVMSQTFRGKYQLDEADTFLLEMKADLAAGRSLLQNATRAACWVVAIAEPMSYLESRRFIESLKELKIPVGGIIVNRLTTTIDILEKFSTLPVPQVLGLPQQPSEPLGAPALDALFAQLQPINVLPSASSSQSQTFTKFSPQFQDFIADQRRLILVGGKGGVGKTTVAGAIAWGMAERHPDRKIRVISIDPAHSLGDVLSTQLGHEPTQITANLSAQEINAKQVLEKFREDYLWELAEMMSGESSDESMQLAYTPQAWKQIVAQALPGIDEMLSLITVMDLLERGEQDLIILDTAPTGHLLRFLEMPTALGGWLAWIFKLWIKYQDVVGKTELMGRLRSLRQQVMQAQKKLKDAHHTEFVGVLQAQSAIVAEAERLTQTLTEMGVSQHYIVHNRCESGQIDLGLTFPAQTLVRLAALPQTLSPLEQVKAAAHLIF